MITQMSDLIPCPNCGTENRFWAISTIDVDDQPDACEAIIKRMLGQEACKKCRTRYRNPPQFAYFDRSHDQWISAFPWDERDEWRECEQQANSLFEIYSHADTNMSARMCETPLIRRVTFGWEALREKIVPARRGLDDVTLELLKRDLSHLLRGESQVDEDLRLVEAYKTDVIIGRVRAPGEHIEEQRDILRARFDAVAADAASRTVREELTKGTYVDLRRLRDR